VIHNTDGRYTTPLKVDNQVYLSRLDLSGEPKEPKLVAHEPKGEKHTKRHAEERAAVKQMRDYRIEAGGKNYRLRAASSTATRKSPGTAALMARSEDMFRYGIDAAAMDWIGNGDHDNGGGREYTWWLTQKTTDAYHLPGRFDPMFTYERAQPSASPQRASIAASPYAAAAESVETPTRLQLTSTPTTRCSTATRANWTAPALCAPVRDE
jgi:hypothetical protein